MHHLETDETYDEDKGRRAFAKLLYN